MIAVPFPTDAYRGPRIPRGEPNIPSNIVCLFYCLLLAFEDEPFAMFSSRSSLLSMLLRDYSTSIGTTVCGTVAARRLDAVLQPSGLAGFRSFNSMISGNGR